MPTKTGERRDGLRSSEFVYRSLKEDIISGGLSPDTRVVELAVAAKYGVSRTPVRESLKRLEAEGLLVSHPTRGLIVHAPDPADIEDVFIVRATLDALATRLAARRITTSGLGRLRIIVESMAEGVKNDNRRQVMLANTMFHDVIYDAAGNAVLQRIGRDLREYVLRYSTLPFASPDRVEHVLSEHMAILDALEKGSADEAVEASNVHMGRAREYLVRIQLREYAEASLRGDGPSLASN